MCHHVSFVIFANIKHVGLQNDPTFLLLGMLQPRMGEGKNMSAQLYPRYSMCGLFTYIWVV